MMSKSEIMPSALSANETEKWRAETWEKLGGNAREMLFQLFMHGPVWDGNCVSKAGRGQLFDLNLATRVQGFTFLTYDGVNLAIKAPVREWADKRWWKKQNGC